MGEQPPSDTTYWQSWGRLQNQVDQLGKTLDALQRDLPVAMEKASARLETDARLARDQLTAGQEGLRQELLRVLGQAQAQYAEDKKEYKETARKTVLLWTVAVTVLAVFQLLPLLLKYLIHVGPTP